MSSRARRAAVRRVTSTSTLCSPLAVRSHAWLAPGHCSLRLAKPLHACWQTGSALFVVLHSDARCESAVTRGTLRCTTRSHPPRPLLTLASRAPVCLVTAVSSAHACRLSLLLSPCVCPLVAHGYRCYSPLWRLLRRLLAVRHLLPRTNTRTAAYGATDGAEARESDCGGHGTSEHDTTRRSGRSNERSLAGTARLRTARLLRSRFSRASVCCVRAVGGWRHPGQRQ